MIHLLDIEGTVCPVTFVHEGLFPYARARMEGFLRDHRDDPGVAAAMAEVARDARAAPDDVGALAAALRSWSDLDRKHPALKELQGRIWREGYRDGSLVAPLYPDVAPTLARWTADGERSAVFSSGSVEAQQLLFAHTDAGDLRGHFRAYFDTRTGPKREAASYLAIARHLDAPCADVTFASDVVEELDAAAAAGMATVWIVREGPLPVSPRHAVRRTLVPDPPVG